MARRSAAEGYGAEGIVPVDDEPRTGRPNALSQKRRRSQYHPQVTSPQSASRTTAEKRPLSAIPTLRLAVASGAPGLLLVAADRPAAGVALDGVEDVAFAVLVVAASDLI